MTGVVLLDVRARALIEHEACVRPRVETGGALFGFADGEDFVIACAYGPGPRAKHRRASFEPHRATTAALMAAVRATSEACYRYLGCWHSHPGGAARPSGQDTATTKLVAGAPDVLLPRPLVLIQATRLAGASAEPRELGAWRWQTEAGALTASPIEDIELDQRYCPVVELPRGRLRWTHTMRPAPPS